ncbi:MAG: thioredoxin domain-containing protein [Desulfobacteraceae bacterium]|jgi:protein-disulfide isomerase
MFKRSRKILLASILLCLSVQYTIYAQENTADIKKEINELRQEQKALHEDLKVIKELLLKTRMPAPPQANVRDVEFELGDNPAEGSDKAPLVLVEFSDYQCPFCARHTKETYPELYRKYIKTGKLRYVVMDKPLPMHDMADEAAEAAHCANEQGKFWEIHKKMMASPDKINDLNSIASSLGLDMKKFKSCMETKKYSNKVASNISLSNKLNIFAAPGFVIASSDPGNPQKVKGIDFIPGAMPFAHFQKEIDQALAGLAK